MKRKDYLERILKARVYDVAIEIAARARARPVARASATGCCSSARTCSRCSPSSCAAPTTRWRSLPRGAAGARRDRGERGQPRAGRGARGAEARLPRGDRDAGDHAADQGRRGGGARRAGGAARRLLRRGLRATRMQLQAQARPDLRASLRRPRRDRRAGHHRHGDPAPAARGRSTRIFVAGRRRRADRGHRRLHQAPAARDEGHRRRAGGRRRHDALAQGGPARDAAITWACSPTAWR